MKVNKKYNHCAGKRIVQENFLIFPKVIANKKFSDLDIKLDEGIYIDLNIRRINLKMIIMKSIRAKTIAKRALPTTGVANCSKAVRQK